LQDEGGAFEWLDGLFAGAVTEMRGKSGEIF